MGPRSARTLRVLGGAVLTDATRDPLTGRDVRVVGHRQDRPNLPSSDCPFCPGGLEAPDPYTTRWFPNRWPPLPDGRAEVLLYSPEHDASFATLSTAQARAVVDLWVERTEALAARDDVAYVLIFENRGREVGATIDHPHGQIYAYDYVPPAAQAELAVGTCPLCADSPEQLEAARVGSWVVRVPELAAWPFEVLIQPIDHVADLPSLPDRDGLAEALCRSVRALDTHFDAATPYMLWVHQRPCDGGDWPTAHAHVHLVPIWRARGVARFVAAAEVGSAVYFNPVDPVDAASVLRDALRA